MTAIDAILMAAGLVAGAGIDAGAARYARRAASEPPSSGAGDPGWGSRSASGLAGAGIAAAAAFLVPGEMMLFTTAFGWLLLALANIDFRTMLLPDGLNAALLALGAAMVWLMRPEGWLMHISGAALGFAVLWTVEAGYRRLRGREGLGRGDAKLLGAIGIWVGATGLPLVLLIASLSGIVAALVQSWRSGPALSAQTAIAFGPWIALGGFAAWILQFAAPVLYGA